MFARKGSWRRRVWRASALAVGAEAWCCCVIWVLHWERGQTGSGRTNLHSCSRNADPRRNEASATTGSQGGGGGVRGLCSSIESATGLQADEHGPVRAARSGEGGSSRLLRTTGGGCAAYCSLRVGFRSRAVRSSGEVTAQGSGPPDLARPLGTSRTIFRARLKVCSLPAATAAAQMILQPARLKPPPPTLRSQPVAPRQHASA